MIEITNVSKKFRIWEDRSRDLKETTINFLKGKKRSFREVWALKEIDLRIRGGETVAFIGENGSGKSTLLKLLGGIYAPDQGKIVTRGKISSLLDLGVGFHPDLTGEENIYLNGAMLGFDSAEMRARFDEIVAFSEIGDFVYSPIRTYSSGMLMRLGFSVAMCVNPDILLIDEVLAVGDEAFQKKCLNRLETFKTTGKTIVLVSHGLEMVQKFCKRAILLHEGRVLCDDIPVKTIEAYHVALYGQNSIKAEEIESEEIESEEIESEEIESEEIESEEILPYEMTSENREEPKEKIEDKSVNARKETAEKAPEEGESLGMITPEPPHYQRYGTFEAEITGVLIKSERGKETDSFISGEIISICLHIQFHRDIENPNIGICILGQEHDKIIIFYCINTIRKNMNLGSLKRNTDIEVEFIQRASLPEGEYYLTVAVTDSDSSTFYDWHDYVKSFQIKKVDSRWEGKVDLNSQIIVHSQIGLGCL